MLSLTDYIPCMPEPPEQSATRHYRGVQGHEYHSGKRGIPPQAFRWVARLRAEKFARYVRQSDLVVEFGVGAGWNLAELKCARRIGFDVADFLEADLSAKGMEFTADSHALGDSCAEVVICHHMLEHVLHPAATLGEISRVLKPGGRLLLHVPFEEEPRYRRYCPTEPNHHLYSWNAQTLGNLATECGFQLESVTIEPFGYDRAAASWAVKLRLGERGFRLLRAAAHLLLPASEVRLVGRRSS